MQNLLNTYNLGDNIIIRGDFNFIPDNKLDKMSQSKTAQNHKPTKSQETLNLMLENYNLIDIFRQKNKGKRLYTWSHPRPLVRCRPDYFIISKQLEKQVKKTQILPSLKTDHSIIDLNFMIDGPKRGPGFWKLNTSVLREEQYISEINTLLNKIWNDSEDMKNLNTRFDWLKYNVRKHSIVYCKKRAREKRIQEHKIINELQFLDDKICNELASDSEISRFCELKQELELIEEDRARGFWLKTGLEKIENDEKSTRFFFNKAKNNYQKKTITCLETDEGKIITNNKKILNEIEIFYKNLYMSNSVNYKIIMK